MESDRGSDEQAIEVAPGSHGFGKRVRRLRRAVLREERDARYSGRDPAANGQAPRACPFTFAGWWRPSLWWVMRAKLFIGATTSRFSGLFAG
jgi:hypothetical protein